MNRGGDPERDDYGLPPVDIEIPDDARELDRDIQAYHRELRVQRRNRLVRRLGGPLTRDGMVLPLLASCLALTLLAGTLLTMFTARRAVPSTLQTTSAPQQSRPPVGQVGGLLPAASVTVGGGQARALRDFRPSVLALVPAGCRCAAAARQLSAQASAAGVMLYFVGAGPAVIQAGKLARNIGLSAGQVVTDTQDAMGSAYHPVGLTAVLVYRDGLVRSINPDLSPGLQLKSSIQALAGASPQGLDRPGDDVLVAGQAGVRPA
ncbi:MAG: hypothetical protein ACRDND_00820 [Streptosporangiaceae bacterium]